MPILLLQLQYRELFSAIKVIGLYKLYTSRRGIAQQILVLLLLGKAQAGNPKSLATLT
jgi:hypothetical protein